MGMSAKVIKKARGVALVVALPVLLHACAEGTGGSVTAYVAKGPLTGSACTVHRGDTGERLAGPMLSEAGHVAFGSLSYRGVAYVACQGGKYHDELSNQHSSMSDVTLRAAKYMKGAAHFVVTPMTEVAVRYAINRGNGQLDRDNVEQANQKVAGLFGLSDTDIVAEQPINVPSEHATDTTAGRYGVALAALSGTVMGDLDQTSGILPVSNELETVLQAWSDPASRRLDIPNLVDKLNTLTDDEHTADAVPTDVTAKIIAGLGIVDDIPIGQPMMGLNVVSATPHPIPSHAGVVTLMGSGFNEPMSITLGGVSMQGIEIESNNKLTFTLPSKPGESIPVGEAVDLIVRHDGEQAELTGGIVLGCVHSICEQPALLNGCAL